MDTVQPQQQEQPTITIDGKPYKFNELPQEVQRLVILYNNWQVEFEKAASELKKLEFAIGAVSSQIGAEMKKSS